MRYFIKNLLQLISIYLIIQVGLIYIFHKCHHFKPSEMYYSNEFNQAFGEKTSDIIGLGNSKLLSSIDKQIFEDKMKLQMSILGYSSANLSVSRLTLESYLRNCINKPQIVLLEVSWFSFNEERTGFHAITGDLLLEDFTLFKHIFRYSPNLWNNFKQALKEQMKINDNNLDVSYESRFSTKNPFEKNYSFNIKDFEVAFPNHQAGINELLLEDFYSIINTCKENNILLILYTAPEGKEYSLLQKDRNEILNIFYNASNQDNVEYLNYTIGGEYYDDQFELWLQDSHHVNENDLFSSKLAEDIILKRRTY